MSLMMPVCCCSVAQSCPTFCNPMDCSRLGFLVLHHLPEFAKTRVRWFRNAIQPSDFLSSILLLPWVFPSIRVFSNELALGIRWPKYWSKDSVSVLPKNIQGWFLYDWLISSPAVQGTLNSLLQHHSLKTSILWQPFLLSSSHTHTWLLEKPQLLLYEPL